MKDNFLCIVGAQRSGTTYLYHLLDAHPQIDMAKPVKPEPKFFLNTAEYEKGKANYFKKVFPSRAHPENFIGEKSTSYIEYDFVAGRIQSFFPDAKVFVLLRNPVHRALSNYFFSKKNGFETRTLKEVFIDKIPPPTVPGTLSAPPFNYIQRSNYYPFLTPYLNTFKDNFKILIFEELIGNKEAIKNIYNFIGVDGSFIPETIDEKVNANDNYSESVSKEITDVLSDVCAESVKKIESLLNRKITSWHDTI